MSVALAILSAALWGGADFFGGFAARKLSVLVVTWLSQLAGLVSIGAVVLLGGAGLGAEGAAWGAAAGIIGAGTLAIFYAALAAGAMSLVAPLSACGAVIPVVVASARGEVPGRLAVAGMVVALVGVVLIAQRRDAALALTPRVLSLAAAAAVGIGTSLTLLQAGGDAPGTSGLGVVAAARAASVLATSALLLVRRTAPRAARGQLLPVAAVGLADTGANALFVVASELGEDALVAVLGSLYPVMPVLLGRLVLAERLTLVKYAGVALALLGVALAVLGVELNSA